MIGFGAGDVFATPNVANPSCLRMGQVQETNVDISFETKKAYGGRQFPFAIARGKGSIKGKTKAGIFQPSLVKSILTGATQVTGQRLLKLKESTGAIVGAAYVVANPTGFKDRGVIDENGNALDRVAAAPAVGQYAVNDATGAYTFNAAATGKVYSVSYTYTSTAVGSYTTTYTNQLMGSGSTYTVDLYNTNPDGSTFGVLLYAVVFDSLSFGFKSEDFTMPDLSFEALADSNDNVLQFYGSQQ